MKKDLISIADVSKDDINQIFKWAAIFKRGKRRGFNRLLAGKSLGMIFEKPSSRTRISFEVAMHQMGGYVIYLGEDQTQLGKRESVADVARTASRYLDGVVLRTFSHQGILEFAKFASIPVINGLSDCCHPCQVLADIFTFIEKRGKFSDKAGFGLKGKKVTFLGDGNNVACSWVWGAAKIGLNLILSSPSQYQIDGSLISRANKIARENGGFIELESNPEKAVRSADLIYTDVWASMGQEEEKEKRREIFSPYQVNDKLVSLANSESLVMHCLPAHRGEEITDSVIDGKQSVVWDEAENRLHVQKAVLYLLLKEIQSP
ncbi:MAG: ornithine carbamoyltransferase [Candidatus Ratteibacteria bacterium]|nr:ornithine carbamoyltransferase [Candidatus Ratteibacteria bacterium]